MEPSSLSSSSSSSSMGTGGVVLIREREEYCESREGGGPIEEAETPECQRLAGLYQKSCGEGRSITGAVVMHSAKERVYVHEIAEDSARDLVSAKDLPGAEDFGVDDLVGAGDLASADGFVSARNGFGAMAPASGPPRSPELGNGAKG
ncbi:hypothetical protein UY3_05332 [Chelonia mydas]|uniref:Uncharacterized protein n=1 Tax=Chelonia mydas TaxID=8469 RepID=M7BJZ1_CHEMY|nr:hypothetical protein UY3_05332 [Chelonia mydas]